MKFKDSNFPLIYGLEVLKIPEHSLTELAFKITAPAGEKLLTFLDRATVYALGHALQLWYETGELEEKPKKVFCYFSPGDLARGNLAAKGFIMATSLEEAMRKAGVIEPRYFTWYELKPEDAIKVGE